jgi:t-SNARE complex subunit (syntaxin)
VAKKMSDYFFGRFADIVSPVIVKKVATGTIVTEKRVKEIKSNFLNKYIFSTIVILILLLVVIFYFVSR